MSISARTQDAARRKHRNSAPAINKTLFFAVLLVAGPAGIARRRYKTRVHLFQINIFKLYEQHWGNLYCKRRKRNSMISATSPKNGNKHRGALEFPRAVKIRSQPARGTFPRSPSFGGKRTKPSATVPDRILGVTNSRKIQAVETTNGHPSRCGDQREDADLQDHAHCYRSVSFCSCA